MTAKDRRKRLRIVHKLQLKYTLSLLLPFFIIFIIIELQMFYVIKYLLPYIEFLAVRGVIVKSIIIIMVEVLILLSLAGLFNIIYLHRIAGPISRLIKEIDEMVVSKKYHLLTVRKKDELASLIQKFNLIIEELIRKTE
jgi:signal transduction histidine kinase